MSGNIHTRIEEVTEPPVNEANEGIQANQPKELTENDDEDKKPVELLLCDVCNIKVTSNKILQRHLDGRRHKMKVQRNGKTYYCDICELTANSETQLNIHLLSSKHRAKLSRKEFNEFTDFSTNAKALCVVIICVLIVVGNIIVLFKAAQPQY